jgi:hypothetical protein
MNDEINSRAKVISRLFKNADVVLDEYKCSKDPLVEKGTRLFLEQVAEAEGAEPEVPFRARHMYRNTPSHQLSSEINQALADLLAE